MLCSRSHGRCVVNTCWYAFCVLAGMGLVWSKHVEMHLVSWLAWDDFDQCMLSSYLWSRWLCLSFVETSWDTFCVLAGICWVKKTHVEMNFVLAGMGWVWITHVEIRSMSCIEIYIRWHWMGLFSTGWDKFFVLFGMGTHVQIHFLSSLAFNGFDQHRLRDIL